MQSPYRYIFETGFLGSIYERGVGIYSFESMSSCPFSFRPRSCTPFFEAAFLGAFCIYGRGARNLLVRIDEQVIVFIIFVAIYPIVKAMLGKVVDAALTDS